MNSTGLIGVLIKWLVDKSQVDYANLFENRDYIVINPSKVCPVTDGSIVSFSTDVADSDKLEWMLRRSTVSSNPDFDIYYENYVQRPTSVYDDEFPNYRVFLNDIVLVRKSNDEIIAAIRQKEAEANASVIGEAGSDKLNVLYAGVVAKLLAGSSLTSLSECEQNVYNRQVEVSAKVTANAANARMLITSVNNNATPNISEGWEYDNISDCGTPF